MAVQWDYVTTVASESDRGKTYDIKRRRSDGHLGCGCTSYRFAPREDKSCKHTRAYAMAGVSFARQDPVLRDRTSGGDRRPAHRDRISVGGETYTFTSRAISFGKIPAGGGR